MYKNFLMLIQILLLCCIVIEKINCKSITTVNGLKIEMPNQIIFEDEFNVLSLEDWERTIQFSGEDNEFVIYDKDDANLFIQNGNLIIKPTLMDDETVRNGFIKLEGCTARYDQCTKQALAYQIIPPIKTAQITTRNSFSFKYGKITIRAKLPKGNWIYPQLWLKPKHQTYGPNYMSGKIRIASVHGNQESLNIDKTMTTGPNSLFSGVIFGTSDENIKARTLVMNANEPLYKNFHNYTYVWKQDSMYVYIDDNEDRKFYIYRNNNKTLAEDTGFNSNTMFRSLISPFDKEFYICLGVAAGGTREFSDSISHEIKPWRNLNVKNLLAFWQSKHAWQKTWSYESKLEIDSVRVVSV